MYCEVSDLQKYFSPIDKYDLKMDLPDFEFSDLTGDKFQLGDAGACVVMYKSGVDLGAAQASALAVDASGKWFYDSDTDLLTIQLGSGEAPQDSDIRLQRSPLDWADAKTEAVGIGHNQVNQFLDVRFPRPLPEVTDNATGANYDQAVVEMCALLACVHLIKSSGSNDWIDLEARVFNLDKTGILDRLNEGEIKLSFELTKSDSGAISTVLIDTATTGFPTDAIGSPTVDFDVYLIAIDVGGTLEAGTENTVITFTVTDSQGNAVSTTTALTGLFQYIGGGMSIRWVYGVYTANDVWSLTVKSVGTDTSILSTIMMVRK